MYVVYVDILRTVYVCQPVMDFWAAMSRHVEDPVGLVAKCFVHTQLSDISFTLTTLLCTLRGAALIGTTIVHYVFTTFLLRK